MCKHGTEFLKLIGQGKNRRKRCSKCNVEKVTKCRQNLKKKLVDAFGGACKICGYNRSIKALEFHHINSTTKLFGISTNKTTKSFSKLLEEAKKCDLLCANCHREIHH